MTSRTFDFKPVITADGRFKGYGAVFDNVDSHRDVIVRGAFRRSIDAWRLKGRWPPMKLMHGSNGNPFTGDDLPVGRWLSMQEDVHGLYVEGELLALDTDQGRRLLSLMKAGVLDALSIGYRVERFDVGTGRVRRRLTDLNLTELSIVDEPSNDMARILPVSPTDSAFDRLRESLAAIGDAKAAAPSADPFDRLRAALGKL